MSNASASSIVLSRNDTYLRALELAYSRLDLFEHGPWKTYSDGIDINNFRGEGYYLAQLLLGATPEKYANMYKYVQNRDVFDWLRKFGEDNAFGCITFEEDGVTYSRDLLDSILELDFLNTTLGINATHHATLLDIGAGYGRFVYRFKQAFPNSVVQAVDAVPLSTYVCEKYLAYRGVDVRTVPLHMLDTATPTAIASNIHSFSECTSSAINFWLDYLCDTGTKYLFLVPHDERWVCCETDGSHPSFYPLVEQHGFKLECSQPKFPAYVDGAFPTTYYLFKR